MDLESEKIRYRKMPFQVKYRKDLNVIDCSEGSDLSIMNHFARNGYENLYITEKGKLCSVITLDDFLNGDKVDGLNRDFIRNLKELHTDEDIERFFIDYPYIDRITVIDGEELVCEVDSLIELPLQNGTAKNIVALRYADMFKSELRDYFESCGDILLIANDEILSFLKGRFPTVDFDYITDIKDADPDFIAKYNVVMDFVYSKNLRRTIGFSPKNLVSMSQIMTRFAIKRLQGFCQEKEIEIKFYRVQNINDLTCLNPSEYNNCVTRVKTGKMLINDAYVDKFTVNEKELVYLKSREYHASQRLDNGYCFIQDECNESALHVHKGIRKSSGANISKENDIEVYFYGPCITYGFLVPDEETIPSLVEKYALKDGVPLSVQNRAGIHGYNELNAIMEALATPVRKGDVMVFYDTMDDLDFSEYPGAQQTYGWFNDEKKTEDIWFLDFPGHCGFQANEVVARHIYQDIKRIIENTGELDHISQRKSYIGDTFDYFAYMRITHSSCIRFLRRYGSNFLEYNTSLLTGVVIIPDSFNPVEQTDLIRKSISQCDRLYILKFNDSIKDIDMGRQLFECTEIEIDNKPVRVFQLGFFFDSTRYLQENTGENDCKEEYLFTEQALVKVLFSEMSVGVRFIPSGCWDSRCRIELEDYYKDAHIRIVNI